VTDINPDMSADHFWL